MARNRKAALRRLGVEQETFMLLGNLLDRAYRDERNQEAAMRLFGSAEAAFDAWYAHRDALLAADPVPGRRLAGFWLFERRCDVPPVVLQPDLLRQSCDLSEREEAQLAAWAALTPEMPADIALDHPAITILEDPDVVDTAPAEARPETEASPAVGAAPQATPAVEVEEEPPEEINMKPHILSAPSPWPQNGRRRPPELEGWETDG